MEVIFEIEYRTEWGQRLVCAAANGALRWSTGATAYGDAARRSQPVTSNTVTKWRPTGGRSAANGGPTVR